MKFAILFMLLALIVAPACTVTEAEETPVIMPLKVGNRWVYSGRRSVTMEITGTREEAGKTWFVMKNINQQLAIDGDMLYHIPDGSGYSEAWAKYPAKKGDTFAGGNSWVDLHSDPIPQLRSSIVTVVSTDTLVSVQGKSYRCYHYRARLRNPGNVLRTYGPLYEGFFAPGIGPVKVQHIFADGELIEARLK